MRRKGRGRGNPGLERRQGGLGDRELVLAVLAGVAEPGGLGELGADLEAVHRVAGGLLWARQAEG